MPHHSPAPSIPSHCPSCNSSEPSPPLPSPADSEFCRVILTQALSAARLPSQESQEPVSQEPVITNEEEAKSSQKTMEVCQHCSEEVCLLDQHWGEFAVQVDHLKEQDNSEKKNRCEMCRCMTNLLLGHLGNETRVNLPGCIEQAIHDEFMDPEGNCAGFKLTQDSRKN